MNTKTHLFASAAGYPLFLASHEPADVLKGLCVGAAHIFMRKLAIAKKAEKLESLAAQLEASAANG